MRAGPPLRVRRRRLQLGLVIDASAAEYLAVLHTWNKRINHSNREELVPSMREPSGVRRRDGKLARRQRRRRRRAARRSTRGGQSAPSLFRVDWSPRWTCPRETHPCAAEFESILPLFSNSYERFSHIYW